MTERNGGLEPFYAMEINALASNLERAGRSVVYTITELGRQLLG